VPGDVVGGGAGPLLAFLAKRAPHGYAEPPWVQAARDGGGPAAGEDDGAPTQGGLDRAPSGRMGARFFANKKAAAAGSGGSGSGVGAESVEPPSTAVGKHGEQASGVESDVAISAQPHLLAELVRLEDAMQALEVRLRESRSAPVQHAVKKQLATKKAEKMKIERQMKEKE
jgi:hypothetical protein